MIWDWGVSPFGYGRDAETLIYPKAGFQNAPKFCENMDKSLATYTFEVPNVAPGMVFLTFTPYQHNNVFKTFLQNFDKIYDVFYW